MERSFIADICDLIHPTRRVLILNLTFISKAYVYLSFRGKDYVIE
jgi:hypothetical protein